MNKELAEATFFNEISFYEVDKDYVDYLYKFDKNVVKHKNGRKYIGIIFIYHNIKYVAPLTSDSNHNKDYLRRHPYKQVTFDIGKYNHQNIGLIRFGNMIPVKDCVLKRVNINLEIKNNTKYGYLLLKQYTSITSAKSKNEMVKLVKRVIKISRNKNHFLHTVKGGICDLDLLTRQAKNYTKNKRADFLS